MAKATPKTKSSRTLVNFILDKSGSMSSVCDATISGFNEYLKSLKDDKKQKYDFSLVLFDTEIKQPYLNVELADVSDLDKKSYIPDGMTALYDAVCKTITDVEEKVKDGAKVLTIIMTDGQENSSKEYTQASLKAKIGRLQKGNWTFVFLGANQDSWLAAQSFGIAGMNTANFNATQSGVKSAMRTMASATIMFASTASNSTAQFFNKDDQDKLQNA